MPVPADNPSPTADREIVTVRDIHAPRELVWKLWTEPAHLQAWYGPAGFTTTTQQFALRAGGQWRFVMHGPDGRDYDNLVTYVAVDAPARLVYRHGGEVEGQPVDFETVVTFDVLPGPVPRTRVTLRAVFATPAAREYVIKTCNAKEGGQQTMARLAERAEALAGTAAAVAGSAPFVVRRVLRAPRDLVFRTWTEREHLTKWFGPVGCTLQAGELDLRPGGIFHYCMRFPGGEMWGKWVFREIEVPARLVFVSSFSDPQGGTCKPPFDANWPAEMLTIVTFEEHAGVGKGTLVTLQSSAMTADPVEQRTFDDGHTSMQQGWGGTFEQLVAYLAAL